VRRQWSHQGRLQSWAAPVVGFHNGWDDGGVEVDHEGYRHVVHELQADPDVKEALMMGMPSLKRGSKMFGGFRDGELLVKIGRERVDELVAAGRARPFDPSGAGRPMKDWALVGEPVDDWLALADEARAAVAGAG
jgi:TfoX/Sxy family transcriptional regulator of competence genes